MTPKTVGELAHIHQLYLDLKKSLHEVRNNSVSNAFGEGRMGYPYTLPGRAFEIIHTAAVRALEQKISDLGVVLSEHGVRV